MYKDLLTQIGLNENEAVAYEYLIRNGETSAGQVIKKTPLKRGVAYNALESLAKKGLIKRITKNKIYYFSPEHPENMRHFAQEKEEEIKKAERTLEANMPKLISEFNLVSNQPGVRYFEGDDGVRKVLWDSLTAKEEIMSFADIDAIHKYIEDINIEYVSKRREFDVKKRIIIDSPYPKQYFINKNPDITNEKYMDIKMFPSGSIMQIYDNKISYLSLSKKAKMGIIIEDKSIYQLQKSIFEFCWQNAKRY